MIGSILAFECTNDDHVHGLPTVLVAKAPSLSTFSLGAPWILVTNWNSASITDGPAPISAHIVSWGTVLSSLSCSQLLMLKTIL